MPKLVLGICGSVFCSNVIWFQNVHVYPSFHFRYRLALKRPRISATSTATTAINGRKILTGRQSSPKASPVSSLHQSLWKERPFDATRENSTHPTNDASVSAVWKTLRFTSGSGNALQISTPRVSLTTGYRDHTWCSSFK